MTISTAVLTGSRHRRQRGTSRATRPSSTPTATTSPTPPSTWARTSTPSRRAAPPWSCPAARPRSRRSSGSATRQGQVQGVSTTFWSAQGYPSEDDTLQLDMRRMDRILEIDEKNMFAVVEPGVIGATLQAEAMKVGLNTHIPGVGCSGSLLAGATSYFGSGPSNMYGGYHYDNMLAMEWVTPTGEILSHRLAGAGLGWFCGEGPGPSHARRRPRLPRGPRAPWASSPSAPSSCSRGRVRRRCRSTESSRPTRSTSAPSSAAYTLAFPDWTGLGRRRPADLGGGHRLHRPPPVQHVRP